MKLEEFMKIDVDNIWEACENHLPALDYFTRKLPEIEYQLALQKLKLEKLVADLDKQIREEATSSGIKLTEKSIENSIKRNETFFEEYKKYLELRKEVDRLKRIKNLFEHRREMISNIVRLVSASGIDTGIVDRMKEKASRFANKDYWEEK